MKRLPLPSARGLLVLAGLLLGSSASANVTLPAVLSEHAILRASAATRIWGKAAPGEGVRVSLAGKEATAKADPAGHWQVTLDLRDAGPGPFELEVKGTNEIKVADVLLGEVWFASGQSNMDFTLGASLGAAEEIARSANPQIRFFKIGASGRPEALDDVKGAWVLVGPSTASNLSAVAYYFAKETQAAIQRPFGVIQSSFGGSSIEAWISPATLATVPEFKTASELQWQLVKTGRAAREAFTRDFPAWLKATGREDHSPAADPAEYAAPEVNTADWAPVKLPGTVTGAGLPATGAIWLRHEIDVAPKAAGKKTTLRISTLDGIDRIYWNGKMVQEQKFADYFGPTRVLCDVPGDLVKEGRNVVAIRLYSPLKPASVTGDAPTMGPEKLTDGWLAKAEFGFPDLAQSPPAPTLPPAVPSVQNTASFLYNSMLHPFLPVTLSGVIWYQGEQNTDHAEQYRTLFPMLINEWRAEFGQKDLPFYFVQLANFMSKKAEPGEHPWASLRDAQSSALALPNTGEAVAIDVGESGDIHYLNKKPVGHRLAALALAHTYGKKDVVPSGPIYADQKIEGSQIRVRFTDTAAGLVAQPLPATYEVARVRGETAPLVRNRPASQVEGFQICGADHKWSWADAKIDGASVVVSAPNVSSPVAVRYGWAANPTVNLYNSAGLPAGPFRTDDAGPRGTPKS